MDGEAKGRTGEVLPDEFVRRMRQSMEQALQRVMEAVNAAPDGSWINGSEMAVKDVFTELRREAYETALQMRLNEAAGSFSPGGRGERSSAAGQGA